MTVAQINGTVSDMDKVTQQNAAMAQESTAACHVLAKEADDLAGLVAQFDAGATPPARRTPVQEAGPVQRPRFGSVRRRSFDSRGSAAQKLDLESANEVWEEF